MWYAITYECKHTREIFRLRIWAVCDKVLPTQT